MRSLPVFKSSDVEQIKKSFLSKTWHAPLTKGPKGGIDAYAFYFRSHTFPEEPLFLIDNPHQKKMSLESYLLTMEFLGGNEVEPYAFFEREIRQLKFAYGEIYYGNFTFVKSIFSIAMRSRDRIMSLVKQAMSSRFSSVKWAPTTQKHPLGTGCNRNGDPDKFGRRKCSGCQKYSS